MIVGVHIIDKTGIPKLSLNLKDEVIEAELMSAIVTTLRTLTESLTEKKELESFSIGGTQFFAASAGEYIVVIATDNYTETDKLKLNDIVKLVAETKDMGLVTKKIMNLIKKRVGLREKSKHWAEEVWG